MEAGDRAIVSDGAKELSEEDATRLRKALGIEESVRFGDVTVDTVRDYLGRTRGSSNDQGEYYEINFVLEKVKRWLDLNQRDQDNRTLLHDALLRECYISIQLLIIHGADPNGDFGSLRQREYAMEFLASYHIAARRPSDQMTLCLRCEDFEPTTFTLPMTKLWGISYWRPNAIVCYDSLSVFTPNDNVSGLMSFMVLLTGQVMAPLVDESYSYLLIITKAA
ncbi:hypothetical protein SLS60_005071 [Paraconiothyrium brasiliense]|uniref:Uncharacterized protein n=1 Tax=Paraconiothyrium brasiliense TaxID=300254 RepID=A0ABR3RGB5_9PLEO